MMKNKLNKSKLIILAVVVLISIIGISYAFFVYYRMGESSSKLIFGDIYLKLNEGTDTITLTNVFPETVEKARKRDDNIITFTVTGINTTTNKDIWYEIMLNEGNEVSGRTRFNPEDLVFDLIEVKADKTEEYVVNAKSFGDINARRIWVDTVTHNTTSEFSKTYKLRMWLSEDVFISDTNPNATYDVNTFENSYASVKISIYGDFVEKEITGYVYYNVDGYDVDTISPTPIYKDDTSIELYIEDLTVDGYKFLGWSTTKGGEVEYKAGSIINVGELVENNLTLYPVMHNIVKLVDKVNATISLTEADVDGTKFVHGADVDNNYVWYSGKLWRIVSIDKNDNIKLVTQGNMTTIAWNTTSSTDYSESQVRRWLNNEFLPTLYDVENLLVSSTWDYTTYASLPTITTGKLETTSLVTEKVGLLNVYEYMMTGGTSTESDTFLNNGYNWWTMSPTGLSTIWYVNSSETTNYDVPFDSGGGFRPSVKLKSEIIILSGTGEKNNPYIIDGDKEKGGDSELISSRISGEYISFNDIKYRIVGIETINGQKLAKVTMADYDVNKNTLSTSQAFGTTSSDVTYNISTGIGKYLLDWYNGTSISSTYKSMIATDGITWYTGPTSGIGYDYTLSKTGTTVNTPIGLCYYGEIFSSQFGEGISYSASIWLMTKYDSSLIWSVSNNDWSQNANPKFSKGVRPSFYLKSDVVIGDVDGDGNVGTGMPHDPYEIKQIS